ADLTFHITDAFDVQIGGRESVNHQTYDETDSGPLALAFFGVDPLMYPTERATKKAFTYLFTPRLKLTPGWIIYARIASGYRPGGPKAGGVLFVFPPLYRAEKTTNYERGTKGDFLDHILSPEASVYYAP